jgi:hypothetical protein
VPSCESTVPRHHGRPEAEMLRRSTRLPGPHPRHHGRPGGKIRVATHQHQHKALFILEGFISPPAAASHLQSPASTKRKRTTQVQPIARRPPNHGTRAKLNLPTLDLHLSTPMPLLRHLRPAKPPKTARVCPGKSLPLFNRKWGGKRIRLST